MAWDFETDPEYQAQLDWADEFVTEEVEPLDLVWRGQQSSPPDDRLRQVIDPLKEEVRKRRAPGQRVSGPPARWRAIGPAAAARDGGWKARARVAPSR
jgi:hypothetical protein